MIKKILFLLIFFSLVQISNAQIAEYLQPNDIADGFAKKFESNKFRAAKEPRLLDSRQPTDAELPLVQMADSILDNKPALSIILIDNGKVIYERYKAPATKDSLMFSYSVSKSLTAYTVGHALCDGEIKSLDDRADLYAPNLVGSVFGRATIRQLLTMNSGARSPDEIGGSMRREWGNVTRQISTINDVLQQYGKETQASGGLIYNNSDTNALMYVLKNIGGMSQIFNNNLWEPSKPESEGRWLVDRKGDPYAAAGASATTRDWARLALHSLDKLKGDNQCMKKYMQEATSPQIPNSNGIVGRYFKNYGYQTWISQDAYWWVGHGGNRIAVNPNNNKIMVLFAHQENFMGDVYRLYQTWSRM
jgi:CubicO group peptidase (beta-lactamase class C family)